MNKKRYETALPTRPWGLNRMREDVIKRLKEMSRIKSLPVNQLVNELLDRGLRKLEEAEVKKQLKSVNRGGA